MKHLNSATLSLVLLAANIYAAEPAKLSDEQAKVLESARASALQYRLRLPDFICTQITHRNTASKSLGAMGAGMATRNPGAIPAGPDSSSDVIEEQLTYVAKKENYEVVTVGGRKVKGITHTQIQGGASSGGEFGSVLAQIFEPSSRTTFNWDRVATLRGRRAYVFAFRVPKQAGTTVADARTHNETIVSFSGLVYIDLDTLEVLEISRGTICRPDSRSRSSSAESNTLRNRSPVKTIACPRILKYIWKTGRMFTSTESTLRTTTAFRPNRPSGR